MDDRFAHVSKDPRFQRVPIKQQKLKIDKRFKGMFNDKRFTLKYTVDKRGRPINSSTSEDLQKYYQLSSSDDDDNEEDEDGEEKEMDESEFSIEAKKKEKSKKKKEMKKKRTVEKEENKLVSNGERKSNNEEVIDSKMSSNDSLIKNKKTKTLEKEENNKTNLQRKRKLSQDTELKTEKNAKKKSKKEIEEDIIEDENSEEELETDVSEDEESGYSESGPDLARGIGNESSSSDDSESDSESDDDVVPSTAEEIIHDWGEFDKNVSLTRELSKRLAVCHMDWDNITAADLFVVFNSFKPPEGTVLSIKIYLSDFGKQRLEEEVAKGPAELAEIALDTNCSENDDTSDHENDEGNNFHNEKLREYQLNRMKYYYAVIECDTIETANHIYSELDGAEYESSKTCFDLRFIPDEMEFDEEAKDICNELPSKDVYKPNQFLNMALSGAEVALTWDETDKKRLETTTRTYNKKNEIKLEDFKDYLALSSEEEEEEEDGDKKGSIAVLASNSENDDDEISEDEDKSDINKYKQLLEGIKETERKKEEKQLEVTWDIGLKEKTEKVLKKKEKKKNSTPWNEFLDKLKEKQKKRKEKIKALKKGTEEKGSIQTFSDDEIPSDVDFNDPYFSSELLPEQKKKSKTQKKKEKENLKKKLQGEIENDPDFTPEERKQKKREMAELALLMADEDDVNEKRHFDYEKIIKEESKTKPKKKVKTVKQQDKDDFKLDVNDDRFSAIYTSSIFNIDKSAPEYKKSSAMEALIEEKLRRRYTEKECSENNQKIKENSKQQETVHSKLSVDESVPSSKIDESVKNLVHSIKTKTKSFNFSKTKPNIKSDIRKKLPKNV